MTGYLALESCERNARGFVRLAGEHGNLRAEGLIPHEKYALYIKRGEDALRVGEWETGADGRLTEDFLMSATDEGLLLLRRHGEKALVWCLDDSETFCWLAAKKERMIQDQPEKTLEKTDSEQEKASPENDDKQEQSAQTNELENVARVIEDELKPEKKDLSAEKTNEPKTRKTEEIIEPAPQNTDTKQETAQTSPVHKAQSVTTDDENAHKMPSLTADDEYPNNVPPLTADDENAHVVEPVNPSDAADKGEKDGTVQSAERPDENMNCEKKKYKGKKEIFENQKSVDESAQKKTLLRAESAGRPLDALPVLYWPEEALEYKLYFEHLPPDGALAAPGWRIVQVMGKNHARYFLGRYAEDARVTRLMIAREADENTRLSSDEKRLLGRGGSVFFARFHDV